MSRRNVVLWTKALMIVFVFVVGALDLGPPPMGPAAHAGKIFDKGKGKKESPQSDPPPADPPKAQPADPPKAAPKPPSSPADPPKAQPADPPKAQPADPPKAQPADPPKAAPKPPSSPADPPKVAPHPPSGGGSGAVFDKEKGKKDSPPSNPSQDSPKSSPPDPPKAAPQPPSPPAEPPKAAPQPPSGGDSDKAAPSGDPPPKVGTGSIFDKGKEKEQGKSGSSPKSPPPSSGKSGGGSSSDESSSGGSSSGGWWDKTKGKGGSTERESSSPSDRPSEAASTRPRPKSDFFEAQRKKARKRPHSGSYGSYYGGTYYPYHYDYYDYWRYEHPYYDPYPRYDHYSTYYEDRYYRRDDRVVLDREEADPYTEGLPYYGQEAVSGSPEETLYDVRHGWLEKDVDLVMRHVRKGSEIRVYYKKKYSHNIEADAFYNLTLDAFERVDTVRFEWRKVYNREEDSFYAQAEHLFFDPREEKRVIYIDYRFQRNPREYTWYITQISLTPPKKEEVTDCFVATAAYGTPLQPQVQVLRRFRDRFLLTQAPGQFLVALYYRLSPPAAGFIARHDTLRAVVRGGLSPLVAIARRVT